MCTEDWTATYNPVFLLSVLLVFISLSHSTVHPECTTATHRLGPSNTPPDHSKDPGITGVTMVTHPKYILAPVGRVYAVMLTFDTCLKTFCDVSTRLSLSVEFNRFELS